MDGDILVIGFGTCGREAVSLMRAQGRTVRVAQRRQPAHLPAGVGFVACDVLDLGQLRAAVKGAAQVVLTIGFAYEGKVWEQVWPRTMQNMLVACAEAGVRLVFLDNLYMYGPQVRPLVETLPLTTHGRKPAARAAATRLWQAQDKVRVAALRAPDFYGPGVTLSHLGTTGLAAIARGKRAAFLFSPDQPHDYAYTPDIGRAIVTLLDAPDDAYGQAWHMPCAPTRTSREIMAMGAAACGRPLRLTALPGAVFALAARFVPFLRNLEEMRFQWDRPYQVDATKWRARFWSDVTPFETGVPATIASFAAP